MSLNSLKMGITRAIGKQILSTKKNSPHIFFAAGAIGVVTATVMACRSTLKLSDTLDDISVDIKSIRSLKTDLDGGVTTAYSTEQYHKDLVYVYAKAGWRITKLYGPSVIIGTTSIVCLTGSHVQLTKRNAALMAAYTAIQEAFSHYRERVRATVGEDKELDLYRGIHKEVLEIEGKKEKVNVVDPNKRSVYARVFDEYSEQWKRDPEYNRIFLDVQQTYMNNILQARGHLFLNEVYSALGLPHSSAGAVVGWTIGNDGDNFVDFGIYEAYNSNFVNGAEPSIWLDFNVDGVIFDKI